MAGILAGFSAVGVVGGATTYFFHRPELNKAGFQLLGRGALQSVIGAVAASVLAESTVGVLENTRNESFSDLNRGRMVDTSFAIYSALLAIFAKHALNRLGLQISYQEALTTTLTANAVGLGVVKFFGD